MTFGMRVRYKKLSSRHEFLKIGSVTVILYVVKIEKNEMGGSCGTYGGRERCAQGFGGDT